MKTMPDVSSVTASSGDRAAVREPVTVEVSSVDHQVRLTGDDVLHNNMRDTHCKARERDRQRPHFGSGGEAQTRGDLLMMWRYSRNKRFLQSFVRGEQSIVETPTKSFNIPSNTKSQKLSRARFLKGMNICTRGVGILTVHLPNNLNMHSNDTHYCHMQKK